MVIKSQNWEKACAPLKSSIRNVAEKLNSTSLKIVMVVNRIGELVGVISDGDIRRGLLRGLSINDEVSQIIQKNPIVVPQNLPTEYVHDLMAGNKISSIPIINKNKKICGLYILVIPQKNTIKTNRLVIMAGGEGKRLLPYTKMCPKPMLKIKGKPILEHIIEKARLLGFLNIIISVNYLHEKIRAFFKDGEKFGVHITYLHEKMPLGTAGGLSMLKKIIKAPFLITNGDVLCDVDYNKLLQFHLDHDASATMAVRPHEYQNPFGVVQLKGISILRLEEKPVIQTHINAGVYVLNPDVLKFLKKDQVCDMPELIMRINRNKMKTIAYPMHEPWLDIGKPEDLKA
ncbi:MAG: nucleotidyltransferase family protein [Verrucomicrobia bacterium]|nr:nucleotidyltransferase family protein [Verrucomicrobiota bacterium]